jgi:hypothetical protein
VKALLVERGRGRQARYSSADDQYPLNIGHVSSFGRYERPEYQRDGNCGGFAIFTV